MNSGQEREREREREETKDEVTEPSHTAGSTSLGLAVPHFPPTYSRLKDVLCNSTHS